MSDRITLDASQIGGTASVVLTVNGRDIVYRTTDTSHMVGLIFFPWLAGGWMFMRCATRGIAIPRTECIPEGPVFETYEEAHVAMTAYNAMVVSRQFTLRQPSV